MDVKITNNAALKDISHSRSFFLAAIDKRGNRPASDLWLVHPHDSFGFGKITWATVIWFWEGSFLQRC